ncbi:unnamed protein product [Tenebrio molitor]|nr:unnamed protein product [Tenebrio molitor]
MSVIVDKTLYCMLELNFNARLTHELRLVQPDHVFN